MELIKYFLIVCLASTIVGQLARIEFFTTSAITLTDAFVLITDFVFILCTLTIRKSLKLKPALFLPAIAFTLYALSTNVLATLNLPYKEVLVSSLFLFRFFSLFLISQVVYTTVSKQKVKNWVNLILALGLIFSVVGILQLIFFPDLSNFTIYGWDPHQKRIFSTFLDPNFAGFAYLIFFNLATAFFLFAKRPYVKTDYFYLLTSIISFLSLILTFSRSSYVAFISSIAIFGLAKSPKLFLLGIIGFVTLFLTVPQMQARVIGALSFDDTSQARVQSWQNGISVFSKNPIFGVGFNTYRYVQARDNVFDSDNPLGGHSGAGVDSSLLLVSATTGIFGIIIFVSLLFFTFISLKKKTGKSPIHLAALATLLSLIVHSLFVNSLFYPQIMLLVWFLVGLSSSYDS